MGLNPAATEKLRALMNELLALHPDYVGPLQTSTEDLEAFDYRAVLAELEVLALTMTNGDLTVQRADGDLTEAGEPSHKVVLVLCQSIGAPADRFDTVIDYLVGMKLFSYGYQAQVYAPASAETVRNRRNDAAASYRFSRNVRAVQPVVYPWLERQSEAAVRARLRELQEQIAEALPAAGTAEVDVPKLLKRAQDFVAEGSLSGQAVFIVAAARVLGLPVEL